MALGIDSLKDVYDLIFSNHNEKEESEEKLVVSPEVKKMDEKYEKERGSLFGEILESTLARIAPGLSKALDVASSVGLKDKDPEAVAWQNEFEAITAWTLFVPDSFLRIFTDQIVKLPFLNLLIQYYPLGDDFEKKLLDKNGNIKKYYDPDDLISFFRLIHQDTISGKVSLDTISR